MNHWMIPLLLATVAPIAHAQTPPATPAKVALMPPLVPWDVEATDIKVTVDGQPVPVHEAKNGPRVRYCHFEADRPVTVLVISKDKVMELASNDRIHTKPEQVAGGWQFIMFPNTKVYIKARRTFICASAPDKNVPKPGDSNVTNIVDTGVKPNVEASSTQAIQKAIDAASKGNRKIVYFPAGVYISGTLYMRDGVTLYLAPGSVLRGSEDAAEW